MDPELSRWSNENLDKLTQLFKSSCIGKFSSMIWRIANIPSETPGKEEVLRWLFTKHHSVHDQKDNLCDFTIRENELEVFKYLLILIPEYDSLMKHYFTRAAHYGKIDFLNHMITSNTYITQHSSNEDWGDYMFMAARRGHKDCVKLLYRTRTLSSFNPRFFSALIEGGDLELLRWFYLIDKDKVLTSSLATDCVIYNKLEILKWLKDNNIPFSSSTAPTAAKLGKLDFLKWLITNGCGYNLKELYKEIARSGNQEVLQWVNSFVEPLTSEIAKDILSIAVEQKHYQMCKFLITIIV